MSTLKSVVGDYFTQWDARKLKSGTALGRFHEKFWGVSMNEGANNSEENGEQDDAGADEEEGEGEYEGQYEGGDGTDEEEEDEGEEGDGDDAEDEEEERGEEGDRDDTEDEGEEEDKDEDEDDFIDGCCILDIDIDDIETSIWVRAEYIRFYNHIAALFEEVIKKERKDKKSSCTIVTGQPGIGKSKFLIYSMRRCCAEQRPFVFYRGGTCYLFVHEGVFAKPSEFPSHEYHKHVWALVDADEATSGVPEELIARFTKLFIIYSTSPACSRWARVHKTVDDRVLVMNPWTWNEILHAAPLRLTEPDFALIEALFHELGPVPRLCIDFNATRLRAYRRDLNKELGKLSIDSLERLVDEGKSLEMDAVSHKVCLIRRFYSTPLEFPDVKISPITPNIGSRIAFQLKNAERHELIRLYKKLFRLPATRKMSGDIFEAYCQQLFCEHISITFVPMVRIGGSKASKKKNQPQWHTTNIPLTPQPLEKKRRAALRKKTPLVIRPNTFVEYTSPKLSKRLTIKPDVYYSLASPNQVGFDSFIIHDYILYLFQFTVKPKHDIKDFVDFVDFFSSCTGIPPQQYWRFIFVRPSDIRSTLTCPFLSTAALQKLPLYSAEVDMK